MKHSFDKPRLIVDLSNAEYHGDTEHLSSSDLKTLLKDPYEVYLKKIEKMFMPQKPSAAMDFGSYVHSLILEPQKTNDEFIVFDGRKQGKRFQDFKAENPGKIIINELSEFNAQEILAAFDKHHQAPGLLKDGAAEISIFGEINGVKVKARADYLTDNFVIDIKTTSFPLDNFAEVVKMRDYALSAALYLDLFNTDGNERDFLFVVIGKNPVEIKVLKASRETIEEGRARYKRALNIFRECKRSGNWQSPLFEEV